MATRRAGHHELHRAGPGLHPRALEGGYADTFLFVDGVKGPEWIDAIDAWDDLEGTLGTVQGGPDRPEKDAFLSSLHRDLWLSAFSPIYGRTLRRRDSGSSGGGPRLVPPPTPRPSATRCGMLPTLLARWSAPDAREWPRALQMIAEGQDINYEGTAGNVDIEERRRLRQHRIWQVSGGEIVSTGEYITP